MSKYPQSVQTAKEMLFSFKKRLAPKIDEYFQSELTRVRSLYPATSIKGIEVYRDITFRGGKRGRAAFSYYVYKMYGGEQDDEAMKMGLVLELVHSYILLLDDFMDRSATRRFGPTAHEMLKKYFVERGFVGGDSQHFGDSLAVTIGTMGFHMAMQQLMDLDFEKPILKALSDNLNQKIEITDHGQVSDIVNTYNPSVTEHDVLKMLEWKTGVYTYENPIHTGAIMAGHGDQSELDRLSEYAIPAGIAFQIQDDILGIFGSPDDTGKSVMDDIREGKYTLLVHYALEKGSAQQIKILRAALGNSEINNEEYEAVKTVLVNTGSLEYSKKTARTLVEKAKQSLEKNRSSQWHQEGYDYLLGIADYMIVREF